MSAITQIIESYGRLGQADQLSLIPSLINEFITTFQTEYQKQMPNLYLQARLKDVAERYPVPHVLLEKETGRVIDSKYDDWMKKGIHNCYSVTSINETWPNSASTSRLLVWFLNRSSKEPKYFKIFEISSKDGQNNCAIAKWFIHGIQNALKKSSASDYSFKNKIEVKKNDILTHFNIPQRGEGNSEEKSNKWNAIRSRIRHYNEVNSKILAKEFPNAPTFFNFIKDGVPSNGIILNIATCDFCEINISF